jgi:hypothetical protein
MEQSASWEANSRSASQKIARILRSQRFITVFTTVRHIVAYTDAGASSPQLPTLFP